MAYERVERLLRMVTILQRDEANTTESLMNELGVSRRTLFRDLRTLNKAGIRHRFDRKRGFHLDQDSQVPPINLTIPETLGLMLLSKTAFSQRDRPMIGYALSAIYKIIATVPAPIHEACKEMMANVSVAPDTQPIGRQDFDRYVELQRCIDEQRCCRVVYRGPADEDDLHAVLDPYLLHRVNGAWYVLGYTDVHDEVRMLKLSRIIDLDPTDERFQRPENFKAEDKLGLAWRMIPEGKEYDVVLEFTAKVATNVSDTRWHVTQDHKILEDGRCLMTFRVDGIKEIAWWICGYSDQVKVIKPPQLRDIVEQMHRDALKQYESPSPAPEVKLGGSVKSSKPTRDTSRSP